MKDKYKESIYNLVHLSKAKMSFDGVYIDRKQLKQDINVLWDLYNKYQELINQNKVYTLEQVKKEWKDAGYELINDYCSDFHFVKKEENTIYNRPTYRHFVVEKVNGGRYFAYSSFAKDNDFINRQYIIISFQEHQLITKTLKALEDKENG